MYLFSAHLHQGTTAPLTMVQTHHLVYSDTSSTLGQVSTIVLSQELQRDTTYYFIVSAESSFQCVRVRGTFQTGGCINSGLQLTLRLDTRKKEWSLDD